METFFFGEATEIFLNKTKYINNFEEINSFFWGGRGCSQNGRGVGFVEMKDGVLFW